MLPARNLLQLSRDTYEPHTNATDSSEVCFKAYLRLHILCTLIQFLTGIQRRSESSTNKPSTTSSYPERCQMFTISSICPDERPSEALPWFEFKPDTPVGLF